MPTIWNGTFTATRGVVNAKPSPTKDTLLELHTMIQGTLRAFPNTKERQQALKAIQWRLRGPNGEYVGINQETARVGFVPAQYALVFDGRDNEHQKLRYYEMLLGPLTVEILPQEK